MTRGEMIAMLASSGAEMRMVFERGDQTPETAALAEEAQVLYAKLEAHYGAPRDGHFWQKVGGPR